MRDAPKSAQKSARNPMVPSAQTQYARYSRRRTAARSWQHMAVTPINGKRKPPLLADRFMAGRSGGLHTPLHLQSPI